MAFSEVHLIYASKNSDSGHKTLNGQYRVVLIRLFGAEAEKYTQKIRQMIDRAIEPKLASHKTQICKLIVAYKITLKLTIFTILYLPQKHTI